MAAGVPVEPDNGGPAPAPGGPAYDGYGPNKPAAAAAMDVTGSPPEEIPTGDTPLCAPLRTGEVPT